MANLIDSIRAVGAAADQLTLACAAHNAFAIDQKSPGISMALRQAYRTSFVTPFDMTAKLRKIR